MAPKKPMPGPAPEDLDDLEWDDVGIGVLPDGTLNVVENPDDLTPVLPPDEAGDD